jgi:hypothetical protein
MNSETSRTETLPSEEPVRNEPSNREGLIIIGIAIAIGMVVMGGTGSITFAMAMGWLAVGVLAWRAGFIARASVAAPALRQQPVDTTRRNLTAIGVLIIFLGGVVGYFATGMDTTLMVASTGHRVHNVGLLHEQTMVYALAAFIAFIGVLCILTAILRAKPVQ